MQKLTGTKTSVEFWSLWLSMDSDMFEPKIKS